MNKLSNNVPSFTEAINLSFLTLSLLVLRHIHHLLISCTGVTTFLYNLFIFIETPYSHKTLLSRFQLIHQQFYLWFIPALILLFFFRTDPRHLNLLTSAIIRSWRRIHCRPRLRTSSSKSRYELKIDDGTNPKLIRNFFLVRLFN